MEQKSNKPLIAMILGICGIVVSLMADGCSCGGFNPISIGFVVISLGLGIAAVILAVQGRKEAPGDGRAIAGLVTGIISVVFGGIATICVVCSGCVIAEVANSPTASSALSSTLNELSSTIK